MSTEQNIISQRASTVRRVESLCDLAVRTNEPGLKRVYEMYEFKSIASVRLSMSERAWDDTFEVMKVSRELVEEQSTITIRDRHSGHEAIFNPLRARRAAAASGPDPAELIEQERTLLGCRWCESQGWMEKGMWADEFGEVWSDDERFVARANWARLAPVSGMVIGDEQTHNLLRLSEADFLAMFQLAERYIRRALETRPAARFFSVFINGGPKSAGSVPHAHLQIVGKEDERHFGYAESILARCPADYWQRVQQAHDDLGLTIVQDGCVAWSNLAPVKERDITVAASTLADGARMLYGLLQRLIRRGTNNYTLSAILSPAYVTGLSDERFAGWPPVLIRWLDRGDGRSRHGDVGAMELFASPIIATDPFVVARWLREDE